jgi:hypothetical protein
MPSETPTVDLPSDLERRGGSAVERDGLLHYAARDGSRRTFPPELRTLKSRRSKDVFLVRTVPDEGDGPAAWLIASVQTLL